MTPNASFTSNSSKHWLAKATAEDVAWELPAREDPEEDEEHVDAVRHAPRPHR